MRANARAVPLSKSIQIRLAQRGAPVIHRTWSDICVSARRPRHAQEDRRRYSAGEASRDTGRAPRPRYGYLLTLHILFLSAMGRNPTEIAAVHSCSRSSVYRTVRAYRAGALSLEYDAQGRLAPPVRTTVLLPTLRRSLLALLKVAPRVHGWCRTR
jgi:Homeodomain-like domain